MPSLLKNRDRVTSLCITLFFILPLNVLKAQVDSVLFERLDAWCDSAYSVYYSRGNLSLQTMDSILVQYPKEAMTLGKEKLYRIIASYHQNNGRPEMSFPYLLKVRESVQERGDSDRLALVLAGIAECYRAFGDMPMADSLIDVAVLMADRNGEKITRAYAHARAGAIKFEVNRKDSGTILPHLTKAIELYHDLHNYEEVGACVTDYATTLYESGEYQAAIESLEEVESLVDDSLILCRILIAKSRVYLNLKEFEEALELGRLAYNIAEKHDIVVYRIEGAWTIEKACVGLQRWEEAFNWAVLGRGLSYDHSEKLRQHDARVVELEFQREKQYLEREHLKERNEVQSTNLILSIALLISVSVLLLILALMSYRLYGQHRKLKKINYIITSDNKRVKQVNQDLSQFIKHRDRLLSALAHDLRAPLATVQSFIEVMRGEPIPPEQMGQLLNTLESQYERSLNMADNMIVWIKSQLEGIDPKIESVDAVKETKEVIELMNHAVQKAKIQIEFSHGDYPMVSADEEMIKFILRNLLSNAVKYSPFGGTVNVLVQSEGDHVVWTVSDQGPGMSSSEKEKLFSEFDASQKEGPRKGAGIGLYLSNYFANIMNGRISVESEVAKGSTFRLELKSA